MATDPHVRALRKVRFEGECWLYVGSRDPHGYGRVSARRNDRWVPALAHRVVYEALVGPIPEGLTLDHLCRNTSCVNPAHLEPVTQRENVQRGDCARTQRARHAANRARKDR